LSVVDDGERTNPGGGKQLPQRCKDHGVSIPCDPVGCKWLPPPTSYGFATQKCLPENAGARTFGA
jgi:hypothetical protein